MDIVNIIHKRFIGEALSALEQQLYNEWISEPENEKNYVAYKKLWSITEPQFDLKPDVNAKWDEFRKITLQKKKVKRIRFIKYLSSAAAAILILIGVFALYQPLQNSTHTYISEQLPLTIDLSDGSVVNLNAHSTLKVSKNYNKKIRKVQLVGEGVFDVQKNTIVPFVIELGNGLNVKVLGTKFNVRSYNEEPKSELKVLEGKVLFEKSNSSVILVKNEEVDFIHNENTFSTKREVDVNQLAWYTKEFNFDNTPIIEAIESLERYINKKIYLPENSKELRYTGSFNSPTEKDIAEVISLAMGWDYKITNKALVFKQKQ